MSFDGYKVEELEKDGTKFHVQQLHVGYAYGIPSMFTELRRANNREQAISFAIEDIGSQGNAHAWRHSESNHGSPEYIFYLRQRIKELEDERKSHSN